MIFRRAILSFLFDKRYASLLTPQSDEAVFVSSLMRLPITRLFLRQISSFIADIFQPRQVSAYTLRR